MLRGMTFSFFFQKVTLASCKKKYFSDSNKMLHCCSTKVVAVIVSLMQLNEN